MRALGISKYSRGIAWRFDATTFTKKKDKDKKRDYTWKCTGVGVSIARHDAGWKRGGADCLGLASLSANEYQRTNDLGLIDGGSQGCFSTHPAVEPDQGKVPFISNPIEQVL